MNKLFSVLKITSKAFGRALPAYILMYLLLPIGLAVFMGVGVNIENQKSHEKIKLEIIDQDNTASSSYLINYLKEANIDIVGVQDKVPTLTIPSGYQESLANNKGLEIDLKDNDKGKNNTNAIKKILDVYHKNIYMNNIESNNLNLLDESSIVIQKYDTDLQVENAAGKDNMLGDIAVGFIGMIVGMFIIGQSQARATSITKNINIRVNSTATSKYSLYMFDLISNFLQIFIILLCYILVFRIWGVAFLGNILIILAMLVVASIFASSLAMFLNCIIPPSFGVAIGMFLMVFSMLGSYSNIGIQNIVQKMNILSFITKTFIEYGLNQNSIVALMSCALILFVSAAIMCITLVRIRFKRVMA